MHFAPDELAGLPESRDRRARVRRNISSVSYLEVGEANGGIVMNVSETGLAIALAQPILDASTLEVRFRLPELERTFQASGQIMWESDSKRSAGLRFLNLAEYDRVQIRNWIRAEIVATELRAPAREPALPTEPGAGAGSASTAKPVLIMPSRKATRDIEADSTRDEARAAEFDRMFPSETTLNERPGAEAEADSEIAEAAKNESAANAFLRGEAERARVVESPVIGPTILEARADESAANAAGVAGPDLGDYPAAEESTAAAEFVTETAAGEKAGSDAAVQTGAEQAARHDDGEVAFGDWRDEWERFHRERENLERANVARVLPGMPNAEPAKPAGAIDNSLFGWQQTAVPEKPPVPTAASAPEIAAAQPKSDVTPLDITIEKAAYLPAGNAPVMRGAAETSRVVMPWESPNTAATIRPRVERTAPPFAPVAEPMAPAAAARPVFTGPYAAGDERQTPRAVVAAKPKSGKNPLDVGALLIALVVVCFVLGYAIQPGAFRFLSLASNDAAQTAGETTPVRGAEASARQNGGDALAPEAAGATAPGADAQNSLPAATPNAEKNGAPAMAGSAPAVPAAADDAGANSIDRGTGEIAASDAPAAGGKNGPATASNSAPRENPATAAAAPANSAAKPSVVPTPAAPTPVTPSGGASVSPSAGGSAPPANPTIDAPVPVSFFPVVAPSGGSAPKLMQLPEEIVYDTPTILVKAREMVFVPSQAGPESEHELERVHVGDRTLRVEPQATSGSATGTVHLRSTIAPDGSISDVQAISGPTNLIPAAVAAVRQWRYKPTDIDGKPIAVEEDITIEFRAAHAS
jgi:TonB family protein